MAETFSVLTRLPGDLRLSPKGDAELMDRRFGAPLLVGEATLRRLPAVPYELVGAAVVLR